MYHRMNSEEFRDARQRAIRQMIADQERRDAAKGDPRKPPAPMRDMRAAPGGPYVAKDPAAGPGDDDLDEDDTGATGKAAGQGGTPD